MLATNATPAHRRKSFIFKEDARSLLRNGRQAQGTPLLINCRDTKGNETKMSSGGVVDEPHQSLDSRACNLENIVSKSASSRRAQTFLELVGGGAIFMALAQGSDFSI